MQVTAYDNTGNNLFIRPLIGQHDFTVRVISPPVGLECSLLPFISCFCVLFKTVLVWTRFFFKRIYMIVID